ncbi:MAG: cell wall hydrolase/autolysin [Bacteroidota bacterium]
MSKLIKNNRPSGWFNSLLLAVLVLTLFSSYRIVPQRRSVVKTVVIDAGHGGHDSGCLGANKVKEKDVALGIALKLGKLLEDNFPDIKVIYTRKTDVFLELHERAQIANSAKADLFICVHCNSACYFDKKKRKELCNAETKGPETWIMGLNRSEANLEVAKRENSVMLLEKDYVRQYDGFDPNSPEADIIFSLYQNTFMEQSLKMASLIQQELTSKGRTNRGVKQAGFWVLYKTTMPSVLIETGFLSNPGEEQFLGSGKGQQEVANGIYKAFKKYRSGIEMVDAPAETEKEPEPKSEPDVEKKPEETNPTTTSSNDADTKEQGVWMSVQFLSSTTPLKSDNARFKGLKNVREEQNANGGYKYFYGHYTTFQEAVEGQSKLRENGFKDAFVVAYKDGKRITVPEARTILEKNNSK